MMTTNPQGPSFFFTDMDRWKNKYSKHIGEREAQKRQIAKIQEINCLTQNTNIKSDGDYNAKAKGAKPADKKDGEKPEYFK